ncbi:MAG TPA: acyltransferase [Thermoanaerobaculia bacterium]|jgi:acetyltransferase-like isoleucine patch superfamily enzyme|nr:acyltransferase [Thermoanaerobaculia bacterium]
MTLRTIRAGELAESLFPRFVDELAERLDDPALDRNETVRDTLRELYGASGGGNSLAAQAVAASFDPRNATLEAEYYRELDPAKWAPVKPLLWFWQMFDHSPVGRNVLLGTRMRAMLARRVFRRCGKNVRIFHECEFSFGYNLSVGDDVTIHRNVLIDDRGEVVVGNNVSISDFANVYSHAHAVEDINDVSLGRTIIGDNTRITYHSTVFSDVKIGHDAMLGSHGVANKDIPDFEIFGGVPARKIAQKKGHP